MTDTRSTDAGQHRATGRGFSLRRAAFAVVALALLGVVGTTASLYLQGYRVWVVHTGSMEPNYMPGDLVIDRPPASHYRVGEVITFRHSDLTTDVVTHRVVAVTPAGLIHTKGDANRTADVWEIRPDQVQGRVMFRARGLGYLMVFLRQPSGIASLATLLFAVVLLWQIFFPDSGGESAVEDTADTHENPDEAGLDVVLQLA